MAPRTETIQNLCHDTKTTQAAERIFLDARRATAVGSGFDLGEARTGLEAVCAYIASQELNNTNVTIEAAQIASCQTMPKFKKLLVQVSKALAAATRRDPLTYNSLVKNHCDQLGRSIKWMYHVEQLVSEKVDELEDDMISKDEITCAVFRWIYHLLLNEKLSRTFEGTYDVDIGHMRQVIRIIKGLCGDDLLAKIREDYSKPDTPDKSAASASPRKSPSKPLRVLPSRDSPQKRKATLPDANDELPMPESPTKRPKLASSTLVTLESIQRQTRSMSDSPTKPFPAPSTPRKPQRAPSKSPTRPSATTSRTELSLESDEEDSAPPPRRRFRPVFQDQKQWAMRDPRIAELTIAANEYHANMTKRYGPPFQDYRQIQVEDVDMDSD